MKKIYVFFLGLVVLHSATEAAMRTSSDSNLPERVSKRICSTGDQVAGAVASEARASGADSILVRLWLADAPLSDAPQTHSMTQAMMTHWSAKRMLDYAYDDSPETFKMENVAPILTSVIAAEERHPGHVSLCHGVPSYARVIWDVFARIYALAGKKTGFTIPFRAPGVLTDAYVPEYIESNGILFEEVSRDAENFDDNDHDDLLSASVGLLSGEEWVETAMGYFWDNAGNISFNDLCKSLPRYWQHVSDTSLSAENLKQLETDLAELNKCMGAHGAILHVLVPLGNAHQYMYAARSYGRVINKKIPVSYRGSRYALPGWDQENGYYSDCRPLMTIWKNQSHLIADTMGDMQVRLVCHKDLLDAERHNIVMQYHDLMTDEQREAYQQEVEKIAQKYIELLHS